MKNHKRWIATGLVLCRIAAGTAFGETHERESEHDANRPEGMILVPAGLYRRGDSFDEGLKHERPVLTVQIDAFFMDRHLVAKKQWSTVHAWAVTNGYTFSRTPAGKGPDHPIHSVSWYDAVKWCNARSEMEGKTPAYTLAETKTNVYRSGQIDIRNAWVRWDAGYRLPTEAEWEKAARGGATGRRFAWHDSDTIRHAQANYRSSKDADYDTSPTQGHHPHFDNAFPRTSPVGHFAPNGYGLFDMTGNVWEWCWNWLADTYADRARTDNPRGSDQGAARALRGGSWSDPAFACRVAFRYGAPPDTASGFRGFRTILPAKAAFGRNQSD